MCPTTRYNKNCTKIKCILCLIAKLQKIQKLTFCNYKGFEKGNVTLKLEFF